jgi:hypothetical protein
MFKYHNPPLRSTVWDSLIQRLFGKKTVHKRDELPRFEEIPPESDETTHAPRDLLELDPDRRYSHGGVSGWKFQGYAPNGNILITTDVYKHVSLQELRTLNKELTENTEPQIDASYRIRRSSGAFEKFFYRGINPINQKLMMVKPEGRTVSVSQDEFIRENSGWNGEIRKPPRMMASNAT